MESFNICGRCSNREGPYRKELNRKWIESFRYAEQCDMCGHTYDFASSIMADIVVDIKLETDHPLILARQKIAGYDLLEATTL